MSQKGKSVKEKRMRKEYAKNKIFTIRKIKSTIEYKIKRDIGQGRKIWQNLQMS